MNFSSTPRHKRFLAGCLVINSLLSTLLSCSSSCFQPVLLVAKKDFLIFLSQISQQRHLAAKLCHQSDFCRGPAADNSISHCGAPAQQQLLMLFLAEVPGPAPQEQREALEVLGLLGLNHGLPDLGMICGPFFPLQILAQNKVISQVPAPGVLDSLRIPRLL